MKYRDMTYKMDEGWLVHSDFLHGMKAFSDVMDRSVGLVYVDPPFDSGKTRGRTTDNAWEDRGFGEYGVSGGDRLSLLLRVGREMHDTNWYHAMAALAIQANRMLKKDGCLWIHCDDHRVHLLKAIVETIVDLPFNSHVVWRRHPYHKTSKRFGRICDHLLFFGSMKNPIYQDFDKSHYMRHKDDKGFYSCNSIRVSGGHTGIGWLYEFCGKPGPWTYSEEGMSSLVERDLIHWPTKKGQWPTRKKYLRDVKGKECTNLWDDIFRLSSTAKERVGYPTQKPLSLMKRIVESSSEEGDWVLDPFCGSGTTLVAAKDMNRRYLGIDESEEALSICMERLT